jgi:lantibiotic biosynthesis protein
MGKLYRNYSQVVLRTPLLNFEFIEEYFQKKNLSYEFFDDLKKNNIVKQALFLASPSFSEELYNNYEKSSLEYKKSMNITLIKYLLRMTTRCTPFGLFAGFTLCSFGDKSDIRLESINNYKIHTRFDMNYLVALSQDLLRNTSIRYKIKYFPNTSISIIDNKIRYVEYKYIKSERTHDIVCVDNSVYLEKILTCAENGSNIKNLCNSIVDQDILYETAEEFVNELIDIQLLVSEIEPSITGDEYIHKLIKTIKDIANVKDIVDILHFAQKSIDVIDSKKLGSSVNEYFNISDHLKKLKTEFKINYLFQTDMYKPLKSGILDKKISENILEGIEFLSKLTYITNESNLRIFKERFERKYGDNEVCILEALDPEFGIGFLKPTGYEDYSPLLSNLSLNHIEHFNGKIVWNKYIELIDTKIIEAIKSNNTVIELTDIDVNGYDSNTNKLAPSFSAIIRIIGKNDIGESKLYISGVGTSSAANLLSRFCHTDKTTNQFVKELKQNEEKILKGNIVAEIIHLPQARVGNVLLHPQFHEYEIPYLACSNAEIEHQIRLSDIFLSIQGTKIIMRSKRLNKRIIPRLSNAHNYLYNAQPIYQFLCEMQFEDIIGSVGLPLSNAIDRYGHIPRIEYKNIILHFAEWKIKKKDIENFSKIKNENELLENVRKWRVKKNIPQFVTLEEGDNALFINFENIFSIEILLSSIKGNEFIISEFLFDEKNAIVTSEQGCYLNEFIISYFRESI